MGNPSPDWRAVKELFHRARELAPPQRESFLVDACLGNEALKRDIESLLAEDASDPAFLETPLDVSEVLTSIRLDRAIGAYRVTRLIGRGGMGTVYAAVRADDAYQRQAAIKVVNRGMDTEDVIQRFRAERQTLARLDHPNIARIIDGGTTEDGLPYFVMDYVDGLPIDVYCDAARLTITHRIDLFRVACDAVSYAHQNLVVHRDLKPENILVTREGMPKLLDFGVAKLLDPDDGDATPKVTRLLDRRMTLSHASPEQVLGLPITTASDVYSLGIVLYTLLSGHRPYRVSRVSTGEAARAICESTARPMAAWLESPRAIEADRAGPTPGAITEARATSLGALRRELSGDLERIVAMALRKEPQRRYASVELLSEDLHRYLRGLPVKARADTLGYRALSFTKRHRVGVVATAIAIVSLVGGTAVSIWQAREARSERQVAERRLSDVRKLANSLLFEIHDAIANLPGSTPARELLVRRGLEYLDALAAESSDNRALQLDLAYAYQRIGDVQGNPTNANLGDIAAAEDSYRKGLAIAERLSVHGDWQAGRQLAALYQRTGDLRAFLGDAAGAVAAMQSALEIHQREADAESGIAHSPAGVFTTGSLQRFVHLGHSRVGSRAVIVGAEHVSFSAALTLSHHGVAVAAIVTEELRHQTYSALRWATAVVRRAPLMTGTRIVGIHGRGRVAGVELADVRTGHRRRLECDTVVFTGNWTPESELAQLGGLAVAPGSRAPVTDLAGRTSRRGVFAAGNLLHAAESAGTAAFGGRHVAHSVATYLDGAAWPETDPVPIRAAGLVRWVSPAAVRPGETIVPHGHFKLRLSGFAPVAIVCVRQGERELWQGRLRRAAPNRSILMPSHWTNRVRPGNGEIVVEVC